MRIKKKFLVPVVAGCNASAAATSTTVYAQTRGAAKVAGLAVIWPSPCRWG